MILGGCDRLATGELVPRSREDAPDDARALLAQDPPDPVVAGLGEEPERDGAGLLLGV